MYSPPPAVPGSLVNPQFFPFSLMFVQAAMPLARLVGRARLMLSCGNYGAKKPSKKLGKKLQFKRLQS